MITVIKRRKGLIALFAVLALVGFTVSFCKGEGPGPHPFTGVNLTAHLQSDPTPPPTLLQADTAASCEKIEVQSYDMYIMGNGVNNDVTVETEPEGNCFTLPYSGTADGHTWYEYQNGDDHCLWDDGGQLELGKACGGSSHPNEELFAYDYQGSGFGWIWSSVAQFPYSLAATNGSFTGCTQGDVVEDASSAVPCESWTFP